MRIKGFQIVHGEVIWRSWEINLLSTDNVFFIHFIWFYCKRNAYYRKQ